MFRVIGLVLAVLLAASPAWSQYNVAPTTCTGGQYLSHDGTTWNCTAPTAVLPSGMVAHFTGACPTGWTEIAAARGRVIVGLPASGTSAGTVGTALTDLQNKSVSLTHTGTAVDDHASHIHTYTTVIAHTHGLSFARGATTGGATTTQGFTSSTDTSSTAITNVTNSTGSASGTTAGPDATLTHSVTQPSAHAVVTSDTISYIQYRACSKD